MFLNIIVPCLSTIEFVLLCARFVLSACPVVCLPVCVCEQCNHKLPSIWTNTCHRIHVCPCFCQCNCQCDCHCVSLWLLRWLSKWLSIWLSLWLSLLLSLWLSLWLSHHVCTIRHSILFFPSTVNEDTQRPWFSLSTPRAVHVSPSLSVMFVPLISSLLYLLVYRSTKF